MNKKENFLMDFRNLLNAKEVDKKDVNIYCNILKENEDAMEMLIDNYTNKTVMRYIINKNENHYGLDGRIKFENFKLELCSNSGYRKSYAIHIYKNNKCLGMITEATQNDEDTTIEEQINKINEKIQQLLVQKEKLLKQMA